jgi:PAS domain S-box-containing protein
MPHKPRPSVLTFLVAFGAAILIPVLGFASLLLFNFATSERAQLEKQARVSAHSLIAAVDLELSKLLVAAEALAASPSIQARDYESFQRHALDALRVWSPNDPNKLAVVLRDLTSQQLANTRISWGQPLPRGSNPDVDQEIVRSKRPSIQGLFTGATSRVPIMSIRVPVFTNAEVTHVLSMAIEPDRFADLVKAYKVPEDWVATLVDGNGRVIARSKEHERFFGKLAPEEFRRADLNEDGVWVGPNLDGTPVLGAHERSPLSGWRAFVGVPSATVEQPLRRSLWLIAAFGVGALMVSLLLAIPFGRRITTSAKALAVSARKLGRGEPVEPVVSGLGEIDEVSDALASASVELKQREAALRASEGRLRATHENAAVGIVEIDKEGRFLYVNEPHARLTGHAREELIGRHFAHATHKDDLGRDVELFQRQVAGEFDIYTIEKKHVRLDGTTGWARVSSTAVRDVNGEFLYAVRVIEDITERKQAQRRQKLLVDELNHRVKNTLTTVQALAYQTFRQALPPEVARERFEARLLALSRTHNLLHESHWQGAPLKDVLLLEIEPFIAENPERLSAHGPALHLPARMAVVLGMVFHELATNAAKYGALSTGSGSVEVTWLVQLQAPSKMLHLKWVERNGPVVSDPKRTGFGSRLIESAARRELNGRASLKYAETGVIFELEVPLQADPEPSEMESAAA